MAEKDSGDLYGDAHVESYRETGGEYGHLWRGAPTLLLTTKGAKSGKERVNPMMYQAVGESYAVFASKGGAPEHPAWYHNLLADPDVTVEVGTALVPVSARVAEGEERELIWQRQKSDYPGFADYEQKTSREIPVVILTPRR